MAKKIIKKAAPKKKAQAKTKAKSAKRPTDAPRLDVHLLLDRSGSMSSNWTETILAVNSYCQKLLRDDDLAARMAVTVFDSPDGNPAIELVRPWSDEHHWRDIQPDQYAPRGTTPLYDAIGSVLTDLMKPMPKNNAKGSGVAKGARVQFVVMTDGLNNASREWGKGRVGTLIDDFKKKGGSVVFLGADFDAMSEGDALGVGRGSTMTFDKSSVASVTATLARATKAYGLSGQHVNFSGAQRAAAIKKRK